MHTLNKNKRKQVKRKINIAIDGFSSTGKSTLAKKLAEQLAYTYIDSGAMYRAIALYFLRHDIDYEDHEEVAKVLPNITLSFEGQEICLNNENVDAEVRTLKVANIVSPVATIPSVRDFCVAQQQAFGKKKGVVMDGRDIGTVVFPQAELKIFLGASEEVRVERRYLELKYKGQEVSREDVRTNLLKRDEIDANREYNPLRKAEDAIELDNSALSVSEQIDFIINWVNDRVASIEID